MLRGLSAAAIVRAIGDAAERWSDADFAPRVRVTEAICSRLGYSMPVVEYALDRLFFPLRADTLEATIAAEIGSLSALDGPAESAGRPAGFARGVDRVVIVSSDTTIGVALLPAVFALCAKCDVVVKDRSDLLMSAFLESLVDERPEFRPAAIARTWDGAQDGEASELLASADVVVAFGADAALRAIRTQLRGDARFVAFGHRASVGLIDPSATPASRALLDAIAGDALLYDGDGCLSLHALFVAGDRATAAAFVAELAAAFERVAHEFPTGALQPQRAASVAAYRNVGAFRAAGGRGAIFAPAQGSATVVFDPPRDAPPPFLPRVLPVYPVADAGEAIAYIRTHQLPIMAVGAADARAPQALAFAEAIGAVRVTRFGQMQAPPIGGHHGGIARIADFVRWIDLE